MIIKNISGSDLLLFNMKIKKNGEISSYKFHSGYYKLKLMKNIIQLVDDGKIKIEKEFDNDIDYINFIMSKISNKVNVKIYKDMNISKNEFIITGDIEVANDAILEIDNTAVIHSVSSI